MIKNKKASASLNLHPKADAKLGSIGAPMPGEVLNIAVQVGDKVAKGPIIAIDSHFEYYMFINLVAWM